MWAVLFLHNMIAGSLAVKNIPYGEFVKAVKEGKVSEIAISENKIHGRMLGSEDGAASNTLFRTVRVDPEISQLNDISTGAQSDLSRTTDIARSMVKAC